MSHVSTYISQILPELVLRWGKPQALSLYLEVLQRKREKEGTQNLPWLVAGQSSGRSGGCKNPFAAKIFYNLTFFVG